MNLLNISMRNMRIRKLSTCLTTASIALGTALVAVIWLMAREANNRYDAATSVASYSLIVGPKEGSGLELVLNTVFNYGVSNGVLPYKTYRNLHSGRLRTRGMVRYAIPQSRGDSWRTFPIIGTTDEMFTKFQTGDRKEGDKKVPIHLAFAAGKGFELSHEDLDKFLDGYIEELEANDGEKVNKPIPASLRKAVVGSMVARRQNLSVGSQIVPTHGTDASSFHEHPEAACEVIGVLERTGTPLDRSIYVPLSLFLSMDDHHSLRPGQEISKDNVALSAVLVKSASPIGAQRLRSDFQSRKEGQGAVPFFEIKRLLDIIGRSSDVLEILSYIVLLVTAITVLLGLYNTMNERRREIAIMRALGARRGQILRIILQEALLISLTAGVLGVLLCHVGVYILASGIEAETGISVDWLAFDGKELLLVLGVGVLGSIAGILPAMEGSRVPVAENLGPTS